MKCVIVDDEPLARELLEGYVSRIAELKLVKTCVNAVEAFNFIQERPIDLLFLDIQMPQVTGIELLRSLKDKPRVILTTAYREYAYEAYDLDVVDYMLKPISFDRFLRAIGKVKQLKQPVDVSFEGTDNIQSFADAYIYLRENREMVKVFLKDIVCIESLRDYVRVKTLKQEVITYQKISYLEQKLPQSKFVRVHRSFIVAIDKVTSFTPVSVKVGSLDIPVGRNYKNMALKALTRNNVLQ
ncbi:MAG TPA: response regulator [Cyclobacteriaceae bacterium]|nr:response regulator [Cyclobacteriaceae bacterium]